MLIFLTLLIMGAVVYAFWREGVLTALAMTCNIFLAGLIAFNFWEPLASGLEPVLSGSFLAGFEDAFCLVFLFAGSLAILRVVSNNIANRQIQYHPAVQQGGSVVCALLAGYLLAGFLLCLVQTLPLPEHFLGFDATYESHDAVRRVMPPDRVWLALMARASQGPFANGEPFDPEGSFELRYAKLRRVKDVGEGKPGS
jgi:hypothetical protein